MIRVFAGSRSGVAKDVVTAALARSVTRGLVESAELRAGESLPPSGIFVFVDPDEEEGSALANFQGQGAKIIVFGKPRPEMAATFGLGAVAPLAADWVGAAACPPTPIHRTTRSAAEILWEAHPLTRSVPFASRPFLRFDYADEWNNLGFGRIEGDGGPWAIAGEAQGGDAAILARATTGDDRGTPFVTLMDRPGASLLWWNRSVGSADSCEWALIETFIADWRAEDLPCLPVLSEIPLGYHGAITMRLDCDEDIASARPLFELYRQRQLAFSVAIKTGQEDREDHVLLMKEILEAGGAILSHSVTHAPRWGGSREACIEEARKSVEWLEERLPGFKVRHAVSPFHQNPAYVPQALKSAGLNGFVGGIVANDPEMLLARGGHLPDDDSGVVSHSQQCMMHGDCILAEGDALEVNKAAFVNALRTHTLFGYLDHPFSERYDYGWGSEEHRLQRHGEFLDFIADTTKGLRIAWVNEDEALAWIAAKANIVLRATEAGFKAETAAEMPPSDFGFAVRFKGDVLALSDFIHG